MFNTHIHIANVMWSRQNITHRIVSHLVLPAAGGRCLFVFFLKPPGTARGMPVRPGDSGQVGRSYQPVLAFGYAKIQELPYNFSTGGTSSRTSFNGEVLNCGGP